MVKTRRSHRRTELSTAQALKAASSQATSCTDVGRLRYVTALYRNADVIILADRGTDVPNPELSTAHGWYIFNCLKDFGLERLA
jgi:hypothetical protein